MPCQDISLWQFHAIPNPLANPFMFFWRPEPCPALPRSNDTFRKEKWWKMLPNTSTPPKKITQASVGKSKMDTQTYSYSSWLTVTITVLVLSMVTTAVLRAPTSALPFRCRHGLRVTLSLASQSNRGVQRGAGSTFRLASGNRKSKSPAEDVATNYVYHIISYQIISYKLGASERWSVSYCHWCSGRVTMARMTLA